MKRRFALSLVLLFGVFAGVPARAQSDDEAAIRTLIGEWYVEHRAGPKGRPFRLLAPGSIDASRGYTYRDTGAAALGPRIYTSLAYRALTFNHEITRLKIDPRFARAHVWERGYFYAWAAQRTFENAGSATFVLEKQDDGRWLVLAHQTNTVGIPPNLKTDPMPDLRELFYSTRGKDRDAEKDAQEAKGR